CLGCVNATVEVVTRGHCSFVVAREKSLLALLGSTVGEGIGANLACAALLNIVIANCASSIHCSGYLFPRDWLYKCIFALIGMGSPNAGVTVGLELNFYGVRFCTGLVIVR